MYKTAVFVFVSLLVPFNSAWRLRSEKGENRNADFNFTIGAQRGLDHLYRKINETAVLLRQRLRDGVIQKSFGNLKQNSMAGKEPLFYTLQDVEVAETEEMNTGLVSMSMEWLLRYMVVIMCFIDGLAIASVMYMCRTTGPAKMALAAS